MEVIELILEFLSVRTVMLIALGTLGGMVIGAVPGLTVTMATALLVSLTYPWAVGDALALIMGVFVGGVYAGSISAILLNIPGAPSAIASTFDGYPMAQEGRAGEAIGIGTTQSFFGLMVSMVILLVAAPVVSRFALGFGAFEYFMLAVFGLTIIGSLTGTSVVKGLLAGALGVFVGFIGMDPMYGVGRFTYDSIHLMAGMHFIPILIGLFGIAEVLTQANSSSIRHVPPAVKNMGITLKKIIKFAPLSIRSGLIGSLIGALPGVGGEIAALVSYDQAKRTVKNPEKPFGQGAHEGLIAPESANNACVGGALIPMLTLGIPGDAVTAIIIGAFYIHGLRPGPLFMTENPDLFWVIVVSAILGGVFLAIFGLAGARFFAKIVSVRREIMIPIIMSICVIGAYSVERNVFHIMIMFGFGVLGFIMRKNSIPVGPMVLGIILGPIADENLRRALRLVDGDVLSLIVQFLTRPVTLVLLLGIIYSLVSNTRLYAAFREWLRQKISKGSAQA